MSVRAEWNGWYPIWGRCSQGGLPGGGDRRWHPGGVGGSVVGPGRRREDQGRCWKPDIFSHPHPQGGLYEAVNEVYKTLIPILEAHRDYKKLLCRARQTSGRPSPRSCTRWAQEALPAPAPAPSPVDPCHPQLTLPLFSPTTEFRPGGECHLPTSGTLMTTG